MEEETRVSDHSVHRCRATRVRHVGERAVGGVPRIALAVLAMVAATVATPATARAAEAAEGYVVVLDADRDVVGDAFRLGRTGGFLAEDHYDTALAGFAAMLTPRQVARIEHSPGVAFVSRDIRIATASLTNLAPGESVPTGVRRIAAATNTQVRLAADVGVAVIDTGVDLESPDLRVRDGTSCIQKSKTANDDSGHGTHVAGTIGAQNSGSGTVGVAPGTQLYAVKVLDSSGAGRLRDLICGLDWVARNAARFGIRVVNLSLTAPGSSDRNCGRDNRDALHRAICGVVARNVVVVAAAGNGSSDVATSVPAAYPEVLAVSAIADSDGSPGGEGGQTSCAAIERDDTAATFSNFAVSVAEANHIIAAPGVCVASTTIGGEIRVASGTSFASPHVTAAVALCHSTGGVQGRCAGLTPLAAIREFMRIAAERPSTFGFDGDPGRPAFGRTYGYLVYGGP